MIGLLAGLVLMAFGLALAAQGRRKYRETEQVRDVEWLIGRHVAHDTSAQRRRTNTEALGRRP